MIIKLIGTAIICAITIVYLKNTRPELAFAASVASSIILLIMVLSMLSGVFEFFTDLTQKAKLENTLIKTVLKIIGVGYLTEFSANLVEEFGSKSIADKLVLGGKVLILILSLPIFSNVLELIAAVI